ncbi:hypothetical protein ACOXVJ_22860 [Pseudomonas knackmussii]|uniref:hypothetical protein n=1 Tax=Pseudomonas knackmussii TaxID=65741 RepID=UPI003BC6D0A7
MKPVFSLLALALLLAGCSGTTVNRDNCANELSAAWRELDLAKAEGFAGTVSYSKALTLITAAKTEQQVESYGGCLDKATKARFYIKESRAGR